MNNILVVDDDKVSLDIFRLFLQDCYQVTLETDSKNVLEILQQQSFDLIILDWMMPSLDGLELCEIIKSSPDLHSIPVLIVSAKASNGELAQVRACKADAYISKPFEEACLLGMVEHLLTGKPVCDHCLQSECNSSTIFITEKR